MYDTEHGIVRVPIVIVKNADQKFHPRPDEAVAFLWELPGNKWTSLGDGFATGTVVDRQGRYRIDFQPDPDDSTRSNVVRTWLPTDGRKEMIAMNVASPTTARIVPNPDRLVWTTAACELWLLTLKAGESPRRLWPKSERAFAGE
ncbi:MAG: hypothetical protein HY000_27175 [Planctomycetes bacterium]|nr:hypothetical protein [Planctomycetota bacterium]